MWKQKKCQLMNNPRPSGVMQTYARGDMTAVRHICLSTKSRAFLLGWKGKVVRKQWSARITFSRDLLAVRKKVPNIFFFGVWGFPRCWFCWIFQTGQKFHPKQYLWWARSTEFTLKILWLWVCCLVLRIWAIMSLMSSTCDFIWTKHKNFAQAFDLISFSNGERNLRLRWQHLKNFQQNVKMRETRSVAGVVVKSKWHNKIKWKTCDEASTCRKKNVASAVWKLLILSMLRKT